MLKISFINRFCCLPTDTAYSCDPRIKKFKEEEKARKESEKKAKAEAKKREQEEKERVSHISVTQTLSVVDNCSISIIHGFQSQNGADEMCCQHIL